MGFSRQEYWDGLLCSPPGDLSSPGIEPVSLIFVKRDAHNFPLTTAVSKHLLIMIYSNILILIMIYISPGSSLKVVMLKLKLQYFGHLMRRVDSLEKTDAGRDWGQEEKGTTEDEMAGWHH